MSRAYPIARIDITDPERYARYTAVTPGIAARYGGRFIVRGGRYEAKEGRARARNAIIEFSDYASALGLYDDAEYRKVLPHALEGSEREIVIVEGVEEG